MYVARPWTEAQVLVQQAIMVQCGALLVTNESFGEDPAKGKPKTLTVKYCCF